MKRLRHWFGFSASRLCDPLPEKSFEELVHECIEGYKNRERVRYFPKMRVRYSMGEYVICVQSLYEARVIIQRHKYTGTWMEVSRRWGGIVHHVEEISRLNRR